MDGLYLGVNVASGVAYLGVVRAPDQLMVDDPGDRVEPSASLGDAARLDDFRSRVQQELRRLKPAAVGVMRPRKYNGWMWSAAFNRATLEAAVMLAAVAEGVRCTIVRAEDAAKAVPAPPTKVVELAANRWGIEPTEHWKDRVWAFATAMALAKGT
jgi:hypothetical protein